MTFALAPKSVSPQCPVSPSWQCPVPGTVSVLGADMTCAETVTMSTRELDRLEILGRGAARRLTERQAVEQLGSTERQVGRLCRELRQQGAAGLVSRKRARAGRGARARALRRLRADALG
jgi:hypothetical protein